VFDMQTKTGKKTPRFTKRRKYRWSWFKKIFLPFSFSFRRRCPPVADGWG